MAIRNKFTDWIINTILNRPKTILMIGLIFVGLFAPGLGYFTERYDVRVWFRPTDPNIKILDAFEKQFGNDESAVVLVHSEDGIFNVDEMTSVQNITEELWKVAQVVRVESITNFNETSAIDDEIIIEPFITDERKLTTDYLAKKEELALKHRVLPGYLISKDAKTAMIFLRMIPTITEAPNYQKIMATTKKIVDKYREKTPYSYYISGAAGVNDAFREVAASDNKVILPSMLILIVIYLFFIFRSFWAMVIPMSLTIMSLVVTFGGSFYFGMVYNNIHAILPAILIAICIADAIHIFTTYFQNLGRGKNKRDSFVATMEKNIIPTLLTSISTSFGFLSLAYTDLNPIREMGLMAGVGSIVAWFLTMTIIGPLLILITFKVPNVFLKKESTNDKISERSLYFAQLIKKFSLHIMIFTILLTIVSLYFGSKNVINSNPYKYFSSEIPIKIANDFVKKEFGTSGGPELVFYSGKEDGIKDPVFLKKVEQFKLWAEAKEYVTRTIDIIDIIKEMNQALNNGNPDFYKIPDTQGEVAEQLFLYTMGLPQGMDLNNRMTLNYDSMRMSVLWTFFETRLWLAHVDIFKNKAKELGLKMEITGKMSLFQGMMDYVVGTFIRSVTTALILVGILMMFIFRSFKIGVLSLIPNVLPLIFGSALMYLAGMDLNVGTALVASVCLGIAVDDTIHFLSHYYTLQKEGKNIDESIAHIFNYTGNALFITTLILVSGFGLFLFGDFVPNVNFGLLCAMIFGSALAVDLIFLPALLFQMEKWKSGKHVSR